MLNLPTRPTIVKKENETLALLSDLWFERNQRIFHGKALHWQNRFKAARLNAS